MKDNRLKEIFTGCANKIYEIGWKSPNESLIYDTVAAKNRDAAIFWSRAKSGDLGREYYKEIASIKILGAAQATSGRTK